MKQKIEWYQEILDLEPGSKVFFTLARMLSETGRPEAAVDTLRRGLGYNPEHIEARLMLVDLLFQLGKLDSLGKEVEAIAVMLEKYPGFWAAWTERLARKTQSRDAALALSFFAASLKGETISWIAVLEHGLARLLADKVDLPVSGQSRSQAGRRKSSVTKAVPEKEIPPLKAGRPKEEFKEQSAGVFAREPVRARSLPPEEGFLDTEEAGFEEDEQISLKTRSMAEVLAEQGDYAGALVIYEELLREAGSVKEKVGLEEAITRLNAEINAMSPAPPQASEENHLAGQPVLTRVLDVLEKLVGRVEKRAGEGPLSAEK